MMQPVIGIKRKAWEALYFRLFSSETPHNPKDTGTT